MHMQSKGYPVWYKPKFTTVAQIAEKVHAGTGRSPNPHAEGLNTGLIQTPVSQADKKFRLKSPVNIQNVIVHI